MKFQYVERDEERQNSRHTTLNLVNDYYGDIDINKKYHANDFNKNLNRNIEIWKHIGEKIQQKYMLKRCKKIVVYVTNVIGVTSQR